MNKLKFFEMKLKYLFIRQQNIEIYLYFDISNLIDRINPKVCPNSENEEKRLSDFADRKEKDRNQLPNWP